MWELESFFFLLFFPGSYTGGELCSSCCWATALLIRAITSYVSRERERSTSLTASGRKTEISSLQPCFLMSEADMCRPTCENKSVEMKEGGVLSFRPNTGCSQTCQAVWNNFRFKAVWLLPPIVWQRGLGELYPAERERESFQTTCIVQGQVTHLCACWTMWIPSLNARRGRSNHNLS